MREFVVVRDDASKVLDPTVAALNDVAAFIGQLVMTNTLLAI